MLKSLNLLPVYDSSEQSIMQDLVIPLLCETTEYWRGVGYFSSGWLKVAAQGLVGLIKNNGKAKIVCSPILSENDWSAIVNGTEETQLNMLSRCLESNLDQITAALENDTLNCLSWLIHDGYLEFRFAVIRNGWGNGDYHDKVAVFCDSEGSTVAIHGSFNDSIHGTINGEAFSVFQSWVGGQEKYVENHSLRLRKLWTNNNRQFKVFPTPDAIKEKIIRLRTSAEPPYSTSNKNIDYEHKELEATKEFKPLWPHQKEAITLWQEAGCRGILEMATGTGKTVTALSAFQKILATGEKLALVILVPYLHLVEQWRVECESFKIVVIECSSNNPGWPSISRSLITDFKTGVLKNICFIATHDTAATDRFSSVFMRLPAENAFLIADEVHGLGAAKRQGALLHIFRYRLGLSATPDRWFDDEGTSYLKSFFNGVCFSYPLAKAIGKSLVPYIYKPILVHLNYEELKSYEALTTKISYLSANKSNSNFEQIKILLRQRAQIIASASDKKRILSILLKERLAKIGRDFKHTLVYCAPGTHKTILEEVSSLGLICHEFVHTVGLNERQSILKRFDCGDYQAIIAVKCLDEGVDIPATRTAYILASSTNPREFVQRRGRILRKAENKIIAEIYDFLVFPSPETFMLKRDVDKGMIRREMPRFSEFAEAAENTYDARNTVFDVLNNYGLVHLLDKKPWDVYQELKDTLEIKESMV